MDCFAFARNDDRHTFAVSRRDCARVLQERCPSRRRGRRESRVPDAPAAPCAMVESTRVVATGSPVTSGLPCAMVLTVSSALSPVTGLFCHCRLRIIIRKLDASVGASGPHGFAVRVSAARLATPKRPPHPAPTFVTTAKRPSERARDAREKIADLGSASSFSSSQASMPVLRNSTLTKQWCNRPLATANSSPTGKRPVSSAAFSD
jgi:hypothetical protein